MLGSTEKVSDNLSLEIGQLSREAFMLLFLDAQNRVITQELKKALALVDVRVLDHFIVAGNATLSFATRVLI